MADKGTTGPRWDAQGLGFGLVVGLIGLAMLLGRNGGGLRPVHLLGIVILGAGAAVLVTAIDRPAGHGKGPAPLD
ncbi:hypothetical protein KSP35_04115 [Aquihabitans sp. G128]|uniref:hypothetical protein n=1 Tax=Aquihabitans sp. G128 TaxID=2849779 RepID=UPI001C22C49E|nr:hypothetical protein [Aquihabitans sp. G128]QXC62010.1 hypothetical protein KSP35_04115 [Aquihabitans sp. G128]